MTRTLRRHPAAPAAATAVADSTPPELADLLGLSGAAFAKQWRTAVSKDGVFKANPPETWRLVAAALGQGVANADRAVAAALRLGVDGGDRAAEFRAALAGWLRAAEHKAWRLPALELFGVAAGAPGKPPEDCGLDDRAASFACLRREWFARSAVATLDYRAAAPQWSFRLARQTLFAGTWECAATCDGVPLEPVGPWRHLCWQADVDGEYLELQLPLAGGATLSRQLFLARHVPWLYLADSLHGAAAGRWGLKWRIPAAKELAGRGGLQSRAVRLAGAAVPTEVVPLWLPTNPLEPGNGMLRVANGELLAETAADGRGVVLPAAVVWAPYGELPPTAWKRLTVTHDRRVLRPDEAQAFRLGIDGKACVAFRTPHEDFRTAFLSHQTFDECLIGWLNPESGNLEAWLRIE